MSEIEPLIPHLGQEVEGIQKVRLERRRFDPESKKVLMAELARSRSWSKQRIRELSETLKYKEEKIYKWYNARLNELRRSK